MSSETKRTIEADPALGTRRFYHTSPEEIGAITEGGRFGPRLFFSEGEPYVMTAGPHVTYGMDIKANEILDAGRIFAVEGSEKTLKANISAVKKMVPGIDDDTAMELLDESVSVFDLAAPEDTGSVARYLNSLDGADLADLSWDLQLETARAANELGYRGVAVADEQGTSYLINMTGRNRELVALSKASGPGGREVPIEIEKAGLLAGP